MNTDRINELRKEWEAEEKANDNAVLNPCPPFYRGEEVSADVIYSDFFVGYEFKKKIGRASCREKRRP